MPVIIVVFDVPRVRSHEMDAGKGKSRSSGTTTGSLGMEVTLYDWNAFALFGVVGLGMTTSAGLLLHTVIARLRTRDRDTGDRATCPC
jgi:hypothetical protein